MARVTMMTLAMAAVMLAPLQQPAQAAGLLYAFSSSVGPQVEAQYDLVQRGDGFEERTYPSRKWACTVQQGGYTEGDQINVFLRLFAYLGGENDQGLRLDMPVPVSIEYHQNETETVFTACFFIQEEHQAQAPVPTNPMVQLKQRPEMTVFTRKFGGFATSESDWLSEASALRTLLTRAGKTVRADLMYWNAYDAPFKFWNRRNEVWLLKLQ